MHSTRDIHSFDTAGRGTPLMSAVSLSLLLLSASFAAASLSPAAAQSASPAQQATAVSPDVLKQREEELEATREQQRKAAELQQKLKADIAAIGQDRSKLNQQLIDIATEVRSVETRIGETEADLRPLDSREQQVRASLDSRRTEIVEGLAALVEERQRKQSAVEKDMEAEGARAINLSRQVDGLQGLITKMEQDLKSAAKAAATASLQGAPAAPNGKPNLGALKDPARLSPAIAFASAKGLFAFPANGRKIRDFGGSDGAGGVEKGISLEIGRAHV